MDVDHSQAGDPADADPEPDRGPDARCDGDQQNPCDRIAPESLAGSARRREPLAIRDARLSPPRLDDADDHAGPEQRMDRGDRRDDQRARCTDRIEPPASSVSPPAPIDVGRIHASIISAKLVVSLHCQP